MNNRQQRFLYQERKTEEISSRQLCITQKNRERTTHIFTVLTTAIAHQTTHMLDVSLDKKQCREKKRSPSERKNE